MKPIRQIIFLFVLLLYPSYIIWASDLTFNFNLGANVEIILPKEPGKLKVKTVLNIPEFELKGNFKFSLISTRPLIWEITASSCEAEASSILNKLEEMGYIDRKKFNLPIKGKLILNQITIRREEKRYTFSIKECISPPLFGFNPANLKDIQVEVREDTVQWVIGNLNLGQSTFTNLTGNYTKTGINFTLKSANLELASLSQAISDLNPTFKKDILSKLTLYPLKDFQLTGKMAIRDIKVALVKEKDRFFLNTYKARINMVKPVKIAIFPDIPRVKPAYIGLKAPEIAFFKQNKIQSIEAKDVEMDVSNFIYSLNNNNKQIILNGVTLLQNIQANLSTKGLSVTLDFQSRPTTIFWNKKTLSVVRFNGHINYCPKKIEITNLNCEINSPPHGFLKANLDFALPFDLKTAKINLMAKQIEFSPIFIKEASLKKSINQELIANYDIELKDLTIKGKSRLNQDKEKIVIISPFIDIQPKVKTTKNPLIAFLSSPSSRPPKPFDFSVSKKVAKIAQKWHLEFDQITYGELSPLEGLKIDALLEEPQNHIAFVGRSCGVYLNGGCDFTRDALSCFTEAKSTSLVIENFLGCFVHEAPIYVTGNTSFQFTFISQGKTDQEFINDLNIEGIFNIEAGKIMKLSNLHKSLGFILDILSIVHLNPSKLKDTLPFDSFVCQIKGTPKEIAFKNLRFLSPVIHIYGEGNLKLEKGPIFYLKGEVKRGILKKAFSLKKDLK